MELSPGAAESLQEAVLRVHQAAAEQRLDAAQDAAAQVRAALDAAAEADEISAVRYREIDAALTAAEEELAAAAQAASEDEDRAGQDDDG